MLLFAGLMLLVNLNTAMDVVRMAANGFITRSALQDSINYELIDTSCIILFKFIFTCYSFLIGIQTFSYLYRKKLCSTIHALPLTRTCMYMTNILSGLAGILLPILVTALATGIYLLVNGLNITVIFAWTGLVFGYCLIFYALAILTVMLTGHLVASAAIYLVLNFGLIAAQIVFEIFPSLFYYGISMKDISDMATIFSPFVHLTLYMHAKNLGMTPSDSLLAADHKGIYALCIYAAAAVVFLVISLLLYKRRRLETFGDPIVTKKLQPVFLYAGTALGGTLSAVLLFSLFSFDVIDFYPNSQNTSAFVCLFLLSGIVVYFVINMLLMKTIHVFKSSYKGIVVYTVLASAFLFAVHLDPFGIEEKIPEQADITSSTINIDWGNSRTMKEKDDIASLLKLHSEILKNRDTLQDELYNGSLGWINISITYHLKNDKTLKREYYVPYQLEKPSDLINEACDLMSDSEAMLESLDEAVPYIDSYDINSYSYDDESDNAPLTYSNVWNNSEEDLALLKAIRQDIADGVLKYNLYVLEETEDIEYYFDFTIMYASYDQTMSGPGLSYVITKDCKNTLAVIEQLIEKYGPTGPMETWAD